jgi:hypothetical protein
MAAYFTRTGGSPVFAPVAVKEITSSYTMQNTDFYVGCSGSGIVVTLPVGPTPGQSFVIKDESGNARVNNITVNTSDSKTIDGSATQVLASNFISVTFLWTGTAWSII